MRAQNSTDIDASPTSTDSHAPANDPKLQSTTQNEKEAQTVFSWVNDIVLPDVEYLCPRARDPGILDMHTALWDWGDSTTSIGIVNEADGSDTVSGARAFLLR